MQWNCRAVKRNAAQLIQHVSHVDYEILSAITALSAGRLAQTRRVLLPAGLRPGRPGRQSDGLHLH